MALFYREWTKFPIPDPVEAVRGVDQKTRYSLSSDAHHGPEGFSIRLYARGFEVLRYREVVTRLVYLSAARNE